MAVEGFATKGTAGRKSWGSLVDDVVAAAQA